MFSQIALELAQPSAWSYSKLDILAKCAFQYRTRYVERQKATNETDRSKAIVGTAVHSIIERTLLASHDGSYDGSHLAARVDYELEQVVAELTAIEGESVRHMQSSICTMAGRILSYVRNNNSIIYTEKALAFDAEFQPTPYDAANAFFRGSLDLVLVNPNGTAAVLDHKTGFRHVEKYADQLKTYALLVAFALADEVKAQHNITLKSVQTGLNFVKYEAFDWHQTVSLDRVQDEIRGWFINRVNGLAQTVTPGKVSRGSHCQYCNHRSYCGSKVGTRKKNANPAIQM